jgi:biopolymer transport protein ExbB
METGFFSLVSAAFTDGGIWMWSITFVQIASIAIIAERVFQLYVMRANTQRDIVWQFERDIKTGNLVKSLSAKQPIGRHNPIYNVVQAGAQAASNMGGREEIQARMDEILLHENQNINQRLGYLAVAANVGTLLGLLGTIVGLINSFASVASLGAVEKSKVLTQGISLAMNTTAYGLIVAIPSLVMYAILSTRATTLTEDLNQASLKAYNWLSFNFEAIPKKQEQLSSIKGFISWILT